MSKTVKWFKAPNTPGHWWYWLLGSGIVRSTTVARGTGFGWTQAKKLKGKMLVWTDGWKEASKTARLWCRSTQTPRLPPKKLQNELAKRHGVYTPPTPKPGSGR